MPSEHTVEVLANHHLMNGIARSRCWIFCPTTNEELLRGYDASTQNIKSIIIQYKALSYASATTASVQVDQLQLSTLLAQFHPKKRQYAFYGFCIHRNYNEVDCGYKSAKSPEFFDNCLFVSIHSLPSGTTRLRYSFSADNVYPIVSNKKTPAVPFLRGRELVCGISSCEIGDRHMERISVVKFEAEDHTEQSERATGLSVVRVPFG